MSKNKKGFSNIGFILATLGSAVGLGNLWLFPTALIDNGGIAFLIPYIIALMILGVPFFLLESILGNKWRTSPVITFKNYSKKIGPVFGLLQSITQVFIGTFYVWIIAWVFLMFLNSFNPNFGTDFNYFNNEILNYKEQATNNPVTSKNISDFGVPFIPIVVVIGIFVFCYIVINKGIKKGVELSCKIMIPILFVLLIVFFCYSFTIKGFERGVEAIFKPRFKKILDLKAWSTAFSKALFSLSLISAVVMIYSANAPIERDNTTQTFIIISGDTLIALLGSFIVASTIGGMMESGLNIQVDGKSVEHDLKMIFENKDGSFNMIGDVFKGEEWNKIAIFTKEGVLVDGNIGGSTLIFKTFPVFFNNIGKSMKNPIIGNVLGIFFFLSAVFAGLSSIIGQIETGTYVLKENTGMKRKYGSLVTILIQFFFGLIFLWSINKEVLYNVTSGFFLDSLLLILAFQQALMFVLKPKKVFELVGFNNKKSKIKWNKKLFYSLLILALITVSFVIVFSFMNKMQNFDENYKDVSSFQWIISSFCFFVPITFWTIGILWYKIKQKKSLEIN